MNSDPHESRREAYRNKLKDPRWQKMRLKVFERDKFRCQFCSDEKSTLLVHHLYYSRDCDPWDYPLEALTTLCEGCHEDESQFRRESEDKLIRTLRHTGFSVEDIEYLALTFGTAKFCCSKSEFVEFFNWMMEESQEKHVREYYPDGLPSEWQDAEREEQ